MSSDTASKSFLDDIQIASPCPASWNDMAKTSDEAKRFCGDCRKHVYSIDQLSAEEANTLIRTACASNSSVCLRLFKRADGTIITDDCPVGLRQIRNTWRRIKSTMASAMLLLWVLPAPGAEQKDSKSEPPHLLGKVARPKPPAKNSSYVAPEAVTMLGEPALINWRQDAYQIASIKTLADKIETLNSGKNKDQQTEIEIVKLRLTMAQEGMRNKLYMFASQELSTDLPIAKQLPASTDDEKTIKINLIKNVLKEKLSCLKHLKLNDTEGLQQELDALQTN